MDNQQPSNFRGDNNMVGIYAIKNTINDKIYVGRSTDIHRRWVTHLRDARNGDKCKIHAAM